MMFLENIAQYLESQGVGKQPATNTLGPLDFAIYIGTQGQQDNCLTLIPTGGFNPDLTFSGKGLEEPTFQVIARGFSFGPTWTKIYDTYKLLHGCDLFQLLRAQQSPEGIGLDEAGRCEFSCNFRIIKTYD